jgi:hypothetical protein
MNEVCIWLIISIAELARLHMVTELMQGKEGNAVLDKLVNDSDH